MARSLKPLVMTLNMVRLTYTSLLRCTSTSGPSIIRQFANKRLPCFSFERHQISQIVSVIAAAYFCHFNISPAVEEPLENRAHHSQTSPVARRSRC